MTVNPGTGAGVDGSADSPPLSQNTIARLARAYMATYRGPHGDAPGADSAVTGPVDRAAVGMLVSPALIDAHYRLGRHRSIGDTRVAVYADDDPAGFGPALQIVTDNAPMLMDSVTVLLHRLGVAYMAIMNPVFRARRGPSGELLELEPASDAPFGDGIDEAWIHVQLAESVDPKSVDEVKRLLPSVLAEARQVALDSTSMAATLRGLAAELDSDPEGRFPGPDRKDVAALLRWLADGHFVLLGYQRCQVRDGQSSVDPSSRLGVLRLRTDVLPQLTASDDLLVLAQATMPSYLRYGAYPYIVVVREQSAGDAIEHRFVGLFTVAAMNANVLEIPLISRRVSDALAMAHRDPSHPGQLLLDIIQTIPRSELFALSRQGTARHGDGGRRSRFAPPHAAVPARRPARPLRVVPGVPAPRPLHHRGAAGDAGHPGPRARRGEHRLRRAGQRIALGGSAFHGAAARGLSSAGYRRLPRQRVPNPGPAHRGRQDLG